ncbi:MAG: deoxyribose-phosphate aldolase [Ardenticatenales bacterium]
MRQPSTVRAANPGVPLDLDWALDVRVNRSAVERRAATLTTRRGVKAAAQTAWLLRAVTLLDLTTLAGDDTPGRVQRLCAKARRPVRADTLAALGLRDDAANALRVGAVCVYHNLIAPAVAALAGSGIPVCAVSTGFPAGQSPMPTRLAEIQASVAAGASEIDIVISRARVLTGDWAGLYEEVKAFKAACGPGVLMKSILATGELGTLTNVAVASRVCLMAGSDFIKTSTGKEAVNATLPVGIVMARAIRAYAERGGVQAGLKPAGGVGTAKDVLAWMVLVREELGEAFVVPGYFRIGASSALADIERQLHHRATGRYAARHTLPLG